MNRALRISLFILLFAASFSISQAGASLTSDWRAKVDPALLQAADEPVEFILFLNRQADLSGVGRMQSKQEKGTYVVEQLQQTAKQTQGVVLKILAQSEAEYRSYWIANMIWVRADQALIETLARRADIAHIYTNPSVKLDTPDPLLPASSMPALPETTTAVEWNILKVRADLVWATGYTGQGVTIGGQDTGYDWDHPALINQYRGWNGSSADHNYNWHDAIHEDNPNSTTPNSCGIDIDVPCDDGNHGTHTMGTMVGDDGLENQIGMAPGARWIGCRNMEEGWGTPITYSECYQWFIAPTDLNNQNPDPSKAPDVINNSWSCPPDEGCTDVTVLLSVVQNVRAAGIVTAHSAGNSGPSCETVNAPGGIYDESFTVGNTDSNDVIAFSSSRGPVSVDGSMRLKPDVSAPGTSIRSSVPGTSYATMSGTSMASPHVAGMVALLLSFRPDLAGQPDQIEALITQSALPLTKDNQDCGGVSGMSIPNNTYGWGRIDAYSTLLNAFKRFYIPLVINQP